jgi:DNA polymerase I-like protein with 3'-5' exonuclease and polymerase domains
MSGWKELITCLNRQYSCWVYDPNADTIPTDVSLVTLDTETHMVVEGSPIIPVIMQICYPKERAVHIVHWEYMQDYLDKLLTRNPKLIIGMHTAGFDLHSCGHDLLWKAADEDRIVDVCIRWLHRKLAEGKLPPDQFSLAKIADDLLHLQVDKDEDIRLNFDRNLPVTADQYRYAALDSIVTARLLEVMPTVYPGEIYQTKGYIALKTIGGYGMLVDKDYREKMYAKYCSKLEEAKLTVNLFGVFPGDKSDKGQQARIQSILHTYERRFGVKLPRTEKTGNISLTQDVEVIFEDNGLELPAFLKEYLNLSHYQKFIETYLTDKHLHPDGRVHPMWIPVLKTARASARKPNTTNLPRDEQIRAIYTAPPKHVLVALDYSQMELCMLAESCYQFYGKSVMLDVINSGVDLHEWVGEQIKNKCSTISATTDFRQLAKAPNFGLPGGLGVGTFVNYAKNTWGVELTEEQALEIIQLWKETFPEMEQHLQPAVDEDTLRTKLHMACLSIFPKDPPVTNLQDFRRKMQDKGYEKELIDEVVNPMRRFIARTITGRIRPNQSFCEACNYTFQSAGADCTKYAAYNVIRAGYRVVNYIHDELLVELLYDNTLPDKVNDIARIMRSSMSKICKHVKIEVDYAVMKSWDKKAKAVYDSASNITIWTPEIRKALETESKMSKEEHTHIARNMDPISRPLYKKDGTLVGFQPLKVTLSI